MMTKHKIHLAAGLLSAVILSGCSADDLFSPSANTQWNASGEASVPADTTLTRSLSIGGSSGKTLYFNWDGGEEIGVYNSGGSSVGTMTATVKPGNSAIATIAGSITGTYAVNDQVTYYYPSSKAMSFTGQKGTIADLVTHFPYMKAPVTVQGVDAENKAILFSGVTFKRRYALLRLRFTDAEDHRLHINQLTIRAASGKLVKSMAEDGTPTFFTDLDPMTITTTSENGEYPGELYVALLNTSGAEDTYLFTAQVGGSTYESAAALSAELEEDEFYTVARTLNKTVDGDHETMGDFTISDISPVTYTGSALTPSLSVSYESTALTQGTHYDVHYFNNTNAGKAYVIVTGKGTYDGKTGVTTFTINRAEPTFAFANTSVEKTYGDAAFTNTLNKTTGLTAAPVFSSSNTSVATVNASTGEVTIVGVGSATITATLSDDPNYDDAETSFELTVNKIAASISFANATPSALIDASTFTQTATITGDGTVTYSSSDESVATVNASTGEVTLKTTGSVTITATTADTEHYHYATTTASYTLTISDNPFALITAADLGKVICTDGSLYASVSAATAASKTPSAIIAYVGSAGSVDASSATYKGLAIALTDANSGSTCQWYTANSGTCVSQTNAIATAITYKNGIESTTTLTNGHSSHTHAAAAAAKNFSTGRPSGASAWFLPSMGQWNLIVQGLATKKAGSTVSTNLTTSTNDTYKASNLNSVITGAGGTGFQSSDYWSSTEYDTYYAWRMGFGYGSARSSSKSYNYYVRAVFAF